MTFFRFRFPGVSFGSPGHDLHLSRITLSLLSPRLCSLMVLKCDILVYCDNSLTSLRVITRIKQLTKCFIPHQKFEGGLAL